MWSEHMESEHRKVESPKSNLKTDESRNLGEFPGSPVVRTPRFHCQGPGFSPWSGN